MYNLVSAAASAGINKSTVLRSIKAGRISAQRDATGQWQIEPAEFHRVFAPLPSPATTAPPSPQRDATTESLIATLQATIADLKLERDRWFEAYAAVQRQLPTPAQRDATTVEHEGNGFMRAWRWMRKSA